MEVTILRSVMSKEESNRKGSARHSARGLQRNCRRTTHSKYLIRRHEQAVVSPQSIKVRNHMTPTGRPYKYNGLAEQQSLCMRTLMSRLILSFADLSITHAPMPWKWSHAPTSSAPSEIKIALCYVPVCGRLRVDVLEARNLENRPFYPPFRTYVKLWMVQFGSCVATQRSSTEKQSDSPLYRKQFNFTLHANKVAVTQLVVAVCNGNATVVNDEIGHVILGKHRDSLERAHWEAAFKNTNETIEMWHRLNNVWC
uniref:C2 domain-containing protein n=2 Tax=Trichuris muris TaxID=70415 RepID=A0A5S6Q0E1_TRIMR